MRIGVAAHKCFHSTYILLLGCPAAPWETPCFQFQSNLNTTQLDTCTSMFTDQLHIQLLMRHRHACSVQSCTAYIRYAQYIHCLYRMTAGSVKCLWSKTAIRSLLHMRSSSPCFGFACASFVSLVMSCHAGSASLALLGLVAPHIIQ